MTKHFCDLCGNESGDKAFARYKTTRLVNTHRPNTVGTERLDTEISIEVQAYNPDFGGRFNIDICSACLRKVFEHTIQTT